MAEVRKILPAGLKEFFGNLRLWLTVGDDDIQAAAEPDGELKTSPYYSVTAGTLTKPRVEDTSREQAMTLYGKTSGGVIRPVRLNGDDQLQVEIISETGTRVLAQASPAATTLTDLYTVPALTRTRIDRLFVANRNNAARDIRIAIAPLGVADAVTHYTHWDVRVPGKSTMNIDYLPDGLILTATDVIRVEATGVDVTFQAHGEEF